MNAVEAIELTKTYPGDIRAVQGVSFRVAPGEASLRRGFGTRVTGSLSAGLKPNPSSDASEAKVKGADWAERHR